MPEIPGPHGSIRYERDQWGYPSFFGIHDIAEGAYARGFLHAQDRQVQVQLQVMMAQGRLMEIANDTPLTRMLDRAVRSLNLVGDLRLQVKKLDRDTRNLLQAYCDGFNACIKRRRTPLFLRLLKIPMMKHTPERVILLYRFSSYFGLTSMHQLAEGVIASLVSEEVDPNLFEILLGDAASGLDLASLKHMKLPRPEHFLLPPMVGGSNAFAVSPERSASGGAMLLSEFHLEVGRIPPAMYTTHTSFTDGNYYQGIGIAGLAWLSAGRTRDVAWTYTFGHADNIDILVERCKEETYLADDTWKPLRRRVEKVKIRGKEEPELWTYYDNEYGTVLGNAKEPGDYPCLRWSGLRDYSATDINAARKAMDATTVHEFLDTHKDIRILSLNAVVVDTQGNIGYTQTGQVDQRPEGWTGAYPRKGWDLKSRTPEPRPEAERLTYTNPEEGYIVSANERRPETSSADWITLPEANYRYRRMVEMLESSENIDMKRVIEICYSEIDLCARELLPIWEPLLPNHPRVKDLCDWARNQESYPLGQHRDKMGLFHALHHEVSRFLLEPYMGRDKTSRFLDDMGLMLYFQHSIDKTLRLEKPEVLNADGLRPLLEKAWYWALDRVDIGDWKLPLHSSFAHMLLQDLLPDALGFSSPTLAIPGSPTTPFQTRILPLQGEPLHIGPLFHMIFDMSQPGGWYNFAGGASESRLGPGYGKGLEAWKDGRFALLGPPQIYQPKPESIP